MSDKPITVTYQDILITYAEKDNRWHFELRGRERSAESLENAKKSIDAPVKEKKPFARFQAYYDAGWRSFQLIEVTSIAEKKFGCREEVWCYNAKSEYGKRFKTTVDRIFPIEGRNEGIIKEINDIQKQIKDLNEKIEALKPKLKCYEIPADPEAEKQK